MSTQHIVMPGTAGNYISTESTNIFDSDTAHVLQGLGEWAGIGGEVVVAVSADRAVFGSTSMKATIAAGSGKRLWSGNAGDSFAVDPATQYSVSVAVYTAIVDLEQAITVSWYDATNTIISTSYGADIAITADAWFTNSVTVTSPALAAWCEVRFAHASTAGGVAYLDTFCMRSGSDATFVPSLRIVGDLDLRAKVAPDDWTPTSNQYLLTTISGFDGYNLVLLTTGAVASSNGDGSSARAETSPVLTATDGAAYEIKAQWDVSAGSMEWFQDGVSLGTDTYSAGASSPSTASLVVGAESAGTLPFDGDVYYVEVRDGIDGPIVARMDATDAAGVT